MKRNLVFLSIVVSVIFLSASMVSAQDRGAMDMTGRLGIGANLAMSGGMGMSAIYWLNDLIAFEGIFNYTSMNGDGLDASYFALAGRGMYTLFDYGTVHGSVGGGIAFGSMSTEVAGQDNSENFFGFEAFFLVEHMLNEYFAISGQTGVSFISAEDTTVFSLGTPSMLGLFGFHFYL